LNPLLCFMVGGVMFCVKGVSSHVKVGCHYFLLVAIARLLLFSLLLAMEITS